MDPNTLTYEIEIQENRFRLEIRKEALDHAIIYIRVREFPVNTQEVLEIAADFEAYLNANQRPLTQPRI